MHIALTTYPKRSSRVPLSATSRVWKSHSQLLLTFKKNALTKIRGPSRIEDQWSTNLELFPRQRRQCLRYPAMGQCNIALTYPQAYIYVNTGKWLDSARRLRRLVRLYGIPEVYPQSNISKQTSPAIHNYKTTLPTTCKCCFNEETDSESSHTRSLT